jgi:hypothetical protein
MLSDRENPAGVTGRAFVRSCADGGQDQIIRSVQGYPNPQRRWSPCAAHVRADVEGVGSLDLKLYGIHFPGTPRRAAKRGPAMWRASGGEEIITFCCYESKLASVTLKPVSTTRRHDKAPVSLSPMSLPRLRQVSSALMDFRTTGPGKKLPQGTGRRDRPELPSSCSHGPSAKTTGAIGSVRREQHGVAAAQWPGCTVASLLGAADADTSRGRWSPAAILLLV